jgi:hypothetical protein
MKICLITIKSKNGFSPTSLTILSDTSLKEGSNNLYKISSYTEKEAK